MEDMSDPNEGFDLGGGKFLWEHLIQVCSFVYNLDPVSTNITKQLQNGDNLCFPQVDQGSEDLIQKLGREGIGSSLQFCLFDEVSKYLTK